jgi:hypothetical protein
MPKVGDIVMLTEPLLGNENGTVGICYEVYGSDSGSYIFPNGNYDGFDSREHEVFLKNIGRCSLSYNFINVIRLSYDFNNGLFIKYFEYGNHLVKHLYTEEWK